MRTKNFQKFLSHFPFNRSFAPTQWHLIFMLQFHCYFSDIVVTFTTLFNIENDSPYWSLRKFSQLFFLVRSTCAACCCYFYYYFYEAISWCSSCCSARVWKQMLEMFVFGVIINDIVVVYILLFRATKKRKSCWKLKILWSKFYDENFVPFFESSLISWLGSIW